MGRLSMRMFHSMASFLVLLSLFVMQLSPSVALSPAFVFGDKVNWQSDNISLNEGIAQAETVLMLVYPELNTHQLTQHDQHFGYLAHYANNAALTHIDPENTVQAQVATVHKITTCKQIPYTVANQHPDLYIVPVTPKNAHQCLLHAMSKMGENHLVIITGEDHVQTTFAMQVLNDHKQMKASSFSSITPPEAPTSAGNGNPSDIPLLNYPGPLYISPAITWGLLISLFLLSVLYIGISTLASIERPIRLATTTLAISKEY